MGTAATESYFCAEQCANMQTITRLRWKSEPRLVSKSMSEPRLLTYLFFLMSDTPHRAFLIAKSNSRLNELL